MFHCRKLSIETVIKNVICTEAGSLKDESLKLNDYSSFSPTASAYGRILKLHSEN